MGETNEYDGLTIADLDELIADLMKPENAGPERVAPLREMKAARGALIRAERESRSGDPSPTGYAPVETIRTPPAEDYVEGDSTSGDAIVTEIDADEPVEPVETVPLFSEVPED